MGEKKGVRFVKQKRDGLELKTKDVGIVGKLW